MTSPRFLGILTAFGGVLVSGCSTVLPAQTASTVSPGAYRLGAQLSASPWCGFSFPPQCATLPNGAPVPELRVSGRHGVSDRVDVGLSASASSVLSPGSFGSLEPGILRLGVVVDGKAEVWSRPAQGGRHLISAGAGAGFVSQSPIAEVQLSAPLWYGYQFADGKELFAGPRYVQRMSFEDIDGDGRREALQMPSLGLSVGYASGGPVRFVSALEYFASTTYLGAGTFNLSAGVLWDVGG
jgi:hypothetical protein